MDYKGRGGEKKNIYYKIEGFVLEIVFCWEGFGRSKNIGILLIYNKYLYCKYAYYARIMLIN